MPRRSRLHIFGLREQHGVWDFAPDRFHVPVNFQDDIKRGVGVLFLLFHRHDDEIGLAHGVADEL